MRDAILLMLFTGLRSKTEAFCLKWSNVDFASKTMRFEDTKNGTTLLLPMSNYVFKLLKARQVGESETEFVFPGGGESGHIVDVRKELARLAEASGVSVTPHDLRRTFLTYSEYLNIPLYTRKALVNHSSGKKSDVTAGYTQVPLDQLRKASQKITDYILQNKEPKKGKGINA